MRIHAFEFMDLPGTPRILRDSVVEALGHAMRWSGVCRTAAPVFQEFCACLESDTVLDLCSGSGEPAAVLLEALEENGESMPRFLISDLFPVLGPMERVAAKFPGHIEAIHTPLDATQVPGNIPHGGRVVISAFHHFPPSLARAILKDSVDQAKPIFILEPMTRSGRGAMRLGVYFVAANLLNPFLSGQDRVLKGLFTYVLPLIPLMAAWDGLVSILRMYTRKDFDALVAGFDEAFTWEFRQISAGWGSTVAVFMGRPAGDASA